jgi:hypothetical protein
MKCATARYGISNTTDTIGLTRKVGTGVEHTHRDSVAIIDLPLSVL